jgi:hypothetical protein
LVVSLNSGLSQFRLPLNGAGVAATPTSTPTPSPTPLVTPTPTGTRLPFAIASPSQINFGNQAVNTSSGVQNVTVTNSSAAQLIINGIFLGGLNTNDFARSGGTCANFLEPNQTCTIGVIFRPVTEGSRTANLIINHNAAGSPTVVALSGIGGNQNGILQPVPNSLVFSSRPVGTTSQELIITLRNIGSGSLLMQNITRDGDAADFIENTSRSCRNTTIPPNGSCIIGYQFRPTQFGNRRAFLIITNNGEDGTQEVELTGTGN